MNKKKPRSENPTVKDPQQEVDPNFRPWSDLDPNLLNLIISNISEPRDHLRFAAVCPSWRSASAQLTKLAPYPHPLLITPFRCHSHSPSDSYSYTVLFPHKKEKEKEKEKEKDGFFRIPGTAFASLIASSSFGWLLFSQNFKPREKDDEDDDDYGYGGNKKEEIKKKNRHEEEEDSSVDYDDNEDDSDDYLHYEDDVEDDVEDEDDDEDDDIDDDQEENDDDDDDEEEDDKVEEGKVGGLEEDEDDNIDDDQGENDDDDEEEKDDKVEEGKVGALEEEGGLEEEEEEEDEEDDEDDEVLYDWEYNEKGYVQLFLVNPVTNARIDLPPCHKRDIEYSESILLTAPPRDPDCALIMTNSYTRYVMFCRLNAVNPRWTDMGGYERDKYVKVVKRSLYMVGCNRNAYLLVTLDRSPQIKYAFGVSTDLMRRRRRTSGGPFLSWLGGRTAPVLYESDCDDDCLFLVESAGEILVVFLYEPVSGVEDAEFKVYKVDPKTGKLLRVCDLQDRVLYLGRRNSFSVSATTTTTSGIKGGANHIYLALDSYNNFLPDTEPRTLTDGAIKMKIIPNREAFWLLPSR